MAAIAIHTFMTQTRAFVCSLLHIEPCPGTSVSSTNTTWGPKRCTSGLGRLTPISDFFY